MHRIITTERDKQAATIRRLNEIVADLDRCANRLQVESLRGGKDAGGCSVYAAFECADEAAGKVREQIDEINEALDAEEARQDHRDQRATYYGSR